MPLASYNDSKLQNLEIIMLVCCLYFLLSRIYAIKFYYYFLI